jgi:hypothetical protein
VRNGAGGVVTGQGADANPLACTAGVSVSTCAKSPASTVFSATSANFVATLSATRRTGAVCSPASAWWTNLDRVRGDWAVNEIVVKRMNRKQQRRWNRAIVQPFLDVRVAAPNHALEDAFRYRYPGFRSANDDQVRSETA